VFSAFTSKPTSVGVKLGACGFLCDGIYAFVHEIIIIIVDQKLIIPFSFNPYRISRTVLMTRSKGKMKSNGRTYLLVLDISE
jgi:hypothetical protein